MARQQKFVVVGAGPVGSLAALYAAKRGHDVEIYELRSGRYIVWIIATGKIAWYQRRFHENFY